MLNYGPAILILFSIFVGILLNRRDSTLLREDMNRRFADFRTEMDIRFRAVEQRFDEMSRRFGDMDRRLDAIDRRLNLIESDQKQFFKETGEIQGRLNELSSRG